MGNHEDTRRLEASNETIELTRVEDGHSHCCWPCRYMLRCGCTCHDFHPLIPTLAGEFEEPYVRTMLNPTLELPDDTPISQVQFPTRIRNVLAVAGLKTVGEVREASDAMLISLPDLGRRSVTHLRETLGLPSCDGVRP
jgi:hypothetical protein